MALREGQPDLHKPIRVPAGHYFTIGDNRGESDDSRDWGPVPRSFLIGKIRIR